MPPSAIKGTPVPCKAFATLWIAAICARQPPGRYAWCKSNRDRCRLSHRPRRGPAAPAPHRQWRCCHQSHHLRKLVLTHLTRSRRPGNARERYPPRAVHAGFGQQCNTLFRALAHADSRANAQASEAVLAGHGCSLDFRMSFTVIRPRSSNSSLTTSTRSMRCLCIRLRASSRLAFSLTVISRSRGVMMFCIGWSRLFSSADRGW